MLLKKETDFISQLPLSYPLKASIGTSGVKSQQYPDRAAASLEFPTLDS